MVSIVHLLALLILIQVGRLHEDYLVVLNLSLFNRLKLLVLPRGRSDLMSGLLLLVVEEVCASHVESFIHALLLKTYSFVLLFDSILTSLYAQQGLRKAASLILLDMHALSYGNDHHRVVEQLAARASICLFTPVRSVLQTYDAVGVLVLCHPG